MVHCDGFNYIRGVADEGCVEDVRDRYIYNRGSIVTRNDSSLAATESWMGDYDV